MSAKLTTFSRFVKTGLLLSTLALPSFVLAKDVITQQVSEQIYMLQGTGGNIGVSVGRDGVYLIDDDYDAKVDDIIAAVRKLSSQPIRFVINTHWHGDHTGGNGKLTQRGALMVAHENVRKRMSSEQFIAAFKTTVPPASKKALPVITFAQAINFYWNNDVLAIEHIANAHTDGDAVIRFKKANVLHTGDIFFNGSYPFIDYSSGGSIGGMIKAVETLLANTNDKTQIIPGHGPLASKQDLQQYHAMLVDQAETIGALKREGKSLAQIIELAPSRHFDEQWGQGFIKPQKWVELVFKSL